MYGNLPPAMMVVAEDEDWMRDRDEPNYLSVTVSKLINIDSGTIRVDR
jgi:hypothetical protein